VEEVERPGTPASVKIVGIVIVVVLAWLLFGSALSVVRTALALLGYVFVGVVAYFFGKSAGRRSARGDRSGE
jgi:CDP-diglyceride synthetase